MKKTFLVLGALLSQQFANAQTCKPVANPAEQFKNCTVTFNVTAGAGGGTDKIMRDISTKLTALGVKSMIMNNGGASGSILTTATANSKDACTFLVSSNGNLSLNALRSDIQAPDLEKSFKPVALVATSPFILAARKDKTKGGTNTGLPGLIENMKKTPLNGGNSGMGGIGHLLSTMMAQDIGADPVDVPYKSSGEASIGLQGAQIDYLFESPQTIATAHQSKGNELEILGSSGTKAVTIDGVEAKPLSQQHAALKNMVAQPYLGIMSNATTISEDKRCAMSQLVGSILSDKALVASYAQLGYEMSDGKPESLQAIMKQFDSSSVWAKTYEKIGMRRGGSGAKTDTKGSAPVKN